jgi:glycosyltransferase involved in cell wall biosynthesis
MVGNSDPFETDGGIETFTLNLCEGLSKRNLDITLLCNSVKNQNTFKDKYNIINMYCPLKVFELPIPSFKSLKTMIGEIKKSDIVHINYPNPLSSFLASLICKYYRKRYVLTIHTHLGID